MRPLTSSESDVIRHICMRGWVDADVSLDRAKLAAQIEYLTAEPGGCGVENCPCLDFSYRGRNEWENEFFAESAADESQICLVVDIKDSDWQANLFVISGIISWLEFSSFTEEYPSKLPAISQLC
ncbi:hypothetical protein RQN30_11090 [Arcanobacterium hippocoleae]